MENFHITTDNYGNLTISPTDYGSWDNDSPNTSCSMSQAFFSENCESCSDGTRNLILNGDYLRAKIGRRFKNWDVPYLAIFLANNKNVVKLCLANNVIDSAGFIGLITHLLVHEYVQELDLRNNHIGDPGINFMYYNRDKLKLKVLRLRGNEIGTRNGTKVALTVADNKFIQHLDVAETNQNESSLIYFTTVLRSDLGFDNNLKILDLSRPSPKCAYSKADGQHVAETIGIALRYNATLEELHLQKFSFSCHDVEDMLRNAGHNRTLRLLDLRCNNIGDHGVGVLSKWLRNCCPLHSLLLGHNNISNHGVRALSETVPFSKLTRLDLSHNRFDDMGAVELFNAIFKLPLIKHIRIYGNNIGSLTAEVIEKLLELNIFEQKNIDLKVYRVDGIPCLAYYECD
ncbi:leucine-rich repeat-containing protein 34-like [Copidosoma floridanum]|uniref:leucine-rich repeat-containing protein 34-like n=1 Tax=Copidosoma floridanum TaxID=29053 RepID=UPI0006C9A2A1|nr:leucine-rich repeat-containing protein 34-like [Copidosoma floridanum]